MLMVSARNAARWTREDLARLPNDGNRYEVLDGKLLVTPQASFPHQFAAMRLIRILGDYCERHGLGVAVGPAALILGKDELQPDVEVVPLSPDKVNRKWIDVPIPILAIEILSAATRRRDLVDKRLAYLNR